MLNPELTILIIKRDLTYKFNMVEKLLTQYPGSVVLMAMFEICLPRGATYIRSKFDHHVAPLIANWAPLACFPKIRPLWLGDVSLYLSWGDSPHYL